MLAPICFPSVRCCTRWQRERCHSMAKRTALIFNAILDSDPPPAIRFNRDIPPKLEDIINKALEKDRNLALPGRGGNASRPATAEARYRDGTSQSSEFGHGGGRTGKRLSGRPTAVANIRFLPCACSISVIERVKVAEVPVAGRKLWKILVPAAVILVAVAIAGAFYFRSRQSHAPPDRQRHHRARRFCQQHGRCRLRRHAQDGAQRFSATSRLF